MNRSLFPSPLFVLSCLVFFSPPGFFFFWKPLKKPFPFSAFFSSHKRLPSLKNTDRDKLGQCEGVYHAIEITWHPRQYWWRREKPAALVCLLFKWSGTGRSVYTFVSVEMESLSLPVNYACSCVFITNFLALYLLPCLTFLLQQSNVYLNKSHIFR